MRRETNASFQGSADFDAIDAYTKYVLVIFLEPFVFTDIHLTSYWAAAPPEGLAYCLANTDDVNWPGCSLSVEYDSNAGWPAGIAADTGSNWLMARPEGLRWALKAIQQRWPTKKIVSNKSFG